MKTASFVFVFGLSLFARSAPAAEASMKGWELYSWFDMACSASPQVHSAPNDDSWCFALVEGTNRLKSNDEIVKQKVPLRDLLAKLGGLARGEPIFWLQDDAFPLPAPTRSSTSSVHRRRREPSSG